MKKSVSKVLLTIMLGLSVFGYAQKQTKKDSVYIIKETDDMEDKIYYGASRAMVCINETSKQGFRFSAFVENKDGEIYIKDISIKAVGIGGCVENVELIVKFQDESKIQLKSWNKFNCEGNAWFEISDSDKEKLSTLKISKVKIQNGRTYDSFTTDIIEADSDYFIQLFDAIAKKKIQEKK